MSHSQAGSCLPAQAFLQLLGRSHFASRPAPGNMAESFYKLEDEAFPSFLGRSLDSTSGRATLGNVTLGSGPGLPVAASTVAKIRPSSDSRRDHEQASYLEGREQQLGKTQSSVGEHPRYSLGFKDDLDNADDFIVAHRLSDVLVKISLDETASRNQGSVLGLPPTQAGSAYGRPTELGTDLSTGLLTISQLDQKNDKKALAATPEEDLLQTDILDSGSNSSFLANEELMCADNMNSDVTDDDIDLNNLPDDELEVYFNKLVPPSTQRGRVEGQEIPAAGVGGVAGYLSDASSEEAPQQRYQFLHHYDQEDFRMPDVRLAATGMDSCPASDEDTEDELETARRNSNVTRTQLLPSTSRHLVGESNHPSFRPGLEGGSSDDDTSSGHGGPSLLPGIGHRRSAEGQVISSPVAGDGGGGDGSSGSEESGNDGGVATIPVPVNSGLTMYDALRGLGIVGSSPLSEDETAGFSRFQEHVRNSLPRFAEMGYRVGPVGTGEASSSAVTSGAFQRLSVNCSRMLDRQEALDAMESTDSGPTAEPLLDSVYLRRPQDSTNLTISVLQGTHGSFHLSQVLDTNQDAHDDDEAVDEPDGARHSLGPRGGPCGDVTAAEASDGASEDDNPLSTSLEAKYFSQSFNQDQEDSDEGWNNCPDNMGLEFQQGANASHGVVYQNEEGKWVTDLAYYSNFEKEVDGKESENDGQLQNEDFVPASDAMQKILKDQEEFEKEHQFMQEEQIEPAPGGNSTLQSDSSWKIPPSSHVLMRASQVSSEIREGDESYLRLSLGQFFGQRSEALGCLGIADGDDVKRPSFGYIITSPEKREPFPLIQPSEFSFGENSPPNATIDLGEADKTLKPGDLEKTVNAPGERLSPKGDTDPEPCKTQDHMGAALSEPTLTSGPESSMANQSGLSPDNNSSQLMLSISTIASAIANASVSTDPSQLAAMIVDLSKRNKARNRPEFVARHQQGPSTAQHFLSQPEQSTIPDILQRSICVGEMSAFDIEKYLKTNMSSTSHSSEAHTTFNLSSWAEGLSSSQKNPQAEYTTKQDGVTPEIPLSTKTEKDNRGNMTLANTSSAAVQLSNDEPKSIPIPCSRASLSPTRRTVGSGQYSHLSCSANKLTPNEETTASSSQASNSAARTSTETVKLGERNTKTNTRSLEAFCKNDKNLPRTSQSWKKSQSGLPVLKASSSPTQRLRNVGQELQDRSRDSPEKNVPGNITATPLPQSSEKQAEISGLNAQPSQDPLSGE
ncbi:hypothetical protein ILYODFUR_007877 [Ilyodon furcidens]|uniref:Uncharacterized protein n=1 Tax=Ilyodon furcidens TaxID=33524 RepID=A0ABV0UGD1_9TELE